MTASAIAIIPARLASTRFPRKALHRIDGKPMLAWLIHSVRETGLFESVIVASQDKEILSLAAQLDVESCAAEGDFRNGTQRVAGTVAQLGLEKHTIVNIQGDMPGVDHEDLERLMRTASARPQPCYSLVRAARSIEEQRDRNRVKAVVGNQGRALYFSREAIPHGGSWSETEIHIGVYVFRNGAITQYAQSPKSRIGLHEDLEQLDWMAAGYSVDVVRGDWRVPTVDHPRDVARVDEWLRRS